MSKVPKNIMYNLLGQTSLFLVNILAVRFIFSRLGGEALGIIYFAVLMNRILSGLLSKGLCAPAVREVSIFAGTDPDYIRDFIRTGSLLSWIIFAVFALTIILLTPFLVEKWITLEAYDIATASTVLRILGIATLFSFPVSYYLSLVHGLQRMEVNNFVDVASAIIEQSGIILILSIENNLLYIALWMFFTRFLKTIAYLGVIAYFFGAKSLVPGISIEVVKRNAKFVVNMIFVSIFMFLNKQADKVFVSKMLSVSTLGYYGYVYELVSKILAFTVAVGQAAYPSLCELNKVGDKENFIKQYLRLQDFVCFVMVPLFAVIPFMALPVLSFVFNAETARELVFPVLLLSVGGYMNASLSLPHRVLLANGKPEIAVRQYMYSFFVVTPIVGTLTYFWGLTGAAWSWILIYFIGYVYMVPRVFVECLEIPMSIFFRHIIKIFLLVILSYGTVYIVLRGFSNYTLLSLVIAYSTATIFFLASSYFLISEEFRKLISIKHLKEYVFNNVLKLSRT